MSQHLPSEAHDEAIDLAETERTTTDFDKPKQELETSEDAFLSESVGNIERDVRTQRSNVESLSPDQNTKTDVPTFSIDLAKSEPPSTIHVKQNHSLLGPWTLTNTKDGAAITDGLDVYTQDFSRDENPMRGNWGGRMDFIVSCLGYAVGLGNVWRFPYLCYKNGGGAFMIPYVIMLLIVGIPIFFLEVSLGQFCGSAGVHAWNFSPFFSGISHTMVLISCLFAIYYNMIIAWAVYYFFASFQSPLPWLSCPEAESSDYCMYKVPDINVSVCSARDLSVNESGYCCNKTTGKPIGLYNASLAKLAGMTRRLPAEDYLKYVSLGTAHSEGLHDLGDMHWKITLSYLLTWVLGYLCVFKGIKATGKIVYFTALFPYVVLLTLLINGATLDGALEGVTYYLKPNISKLAEGRVWKDAAVQTLFSLSATEGGLITFASYNRFHNDVLKDTFIVSIGNGCTSLFAGFVIFSYLGYLAKQLGTAVEDVVSEGTALVFSVYPMAMSSLPFPPIWSVLFFFMLILIGLDSAFAKLETILTSILDKWPQLRSKRELLLLAIAVTMFCAGLPMCTDGGEYVLAWLDNYAGGWNMLIVALLECISIGWVYGFKRFRSDIACMLGQHFCKCIPWWPVSFWWGACWCVITPMLLMFVLIFSWASTKPLTNGGHAFAKWTEIPGYILLAVSIVLAFGRGFYLVARSKGKLRSRFQSVLRPTNDWGPALVRHRQLVTCYVPDFAIDPWDDQDDEHEWRRVTLMSIRQDVAARKGKADVPVTTDEAQDTVGEQTEIERETEGETYI